MNSEQLNEVSFVVSDFSAEQKELLRGVLATELKEKQVAQEKKVEPVAAKPRPKRKAKRKAPRRRK